MKNQKTRSTLAIVVAVAVFVIGGIFLASNPNLLSQVLFTPDINIDIEMEGEKRPYAIEEYQEGSTETPGFAYLYSAFGGSYTEPTSITISDPFSENVYYGIAVEDLSGGIETEIFENGLTVYFDPIAGPIHFFVSMNQYRVEDDALNNEIILELEYFNEVEPAGVEVIGDGEEVVFDIPEEPTEELLLENADETILLIRDVVFEVTGVLLSPENIRPAVYEEGEYLVLGTGQYFDFLYFYNDFLLQHPPLEDVVPLQFLIIDHFEGVDLRGLSSTDIELLNIKLSDAYGVKMTEQVFDLSLMNAITIIEKEAKTQVINWESLEVIVNLYSPTSDEDFLKIIERIESSAFGVNVGIGDPTIPPVNLGDEVTTENPLNTGAEILPDGTTVITEDGVVVEEILPSEDITFNPEGGTTSSAAVVVSSKACEYVVDLRNILIDMESTVLGADDTLADASQLYQEAEADLLSITEDADDPLTAFEDAKALSEGLFGYSSGIETVLEKMSSQEALIQDMITWSEEELEVIAAQGGNVASIQDCLQQLKDGLLEAELYVDEGVLILDSLNSYKDQLGILLEDTQVSIASFTAAKSVEENFGAIFEEELKNAAQFTDQEAEEMTVILKGALNTTLKDEDFIRSIIGLPGKPGADGANGLNGLNGLDGLSGSDASCSECDCECDEERLNALESRIIALEEKVALPSAPATNDGALPGFDPQPDGAEILDSELFENKVKNLIGIGIEESTINDEIVNRLKEQINGLDERIIIVENLPLKAISEEALTSQAENSVGFNPQAFGEYMESPEFGPQFAQFFQKFLQNQGGTLIINFIQNFFFGGGAPIPGISGVSCWDTNGNYLKEEAEDLNGDGKYDALDCQGAEGPKGDQGEPGAPGQDGKDGQDGQDGQNGSCSANQCETAAEKTVRESVQNNIEQAADDAVEEALEEKVPTIINNVIRQNGGTSSSSTSPTSVTNNVTNPTSPASLLSQANRGSAPAVAEGPAKCELDFADISNLSEEEQKTVYFMKCVLGLLKGSQRPDGKVYFSPDDKFNREHFAQMIFRYLGNEEESFALAQQLPQRFIDVPVNAWYFAAVQIADYYKYMTGIDGGNTFEPGRPLTRLEVARVMATLVGGDYPQVEDIYQRELNTPGVEWWRAAYNTYVEVVGEAPFDISDIDQVAAGTSFTRLETSTMLRKFYEAANPSLATRLDNEYQN